MLITKCGLLGFHSFLLTRVISEILLENSLAKLTCTLNAFPLGSDGNIASTEAEGCMFGRGGRQELRRPETYRGLQKPQGHQEGHQDSQPHLQSEVHTQAAWNTGSGFTFYPLLWSMPNTKGWSIEDSMKACSRNNAIEWPSFWKV